MTTFTIFEFSSRDTGESRFVAVRADTSHDRPCLRHLDRFRSGRNWDIVAIYQVTKPDLAEARQWLDYCLSGE